MEEGEPRGEQEVGGHSDEQECLLIKEAGLCTA